MPRRNFVCTQKAVILKVTLQKGVMSLTLASPRHLWSGLVACRLAGDLLAKHLMADQTPFHYIAYLFCTTTIIAGENPVADPITKSR